MMLNAIVKQKIFIQLQIGGGGTYSLDENILIVFLK